MHVQRNFGLDLARALAISMVFLSHGVSALDTLGVGVDLFFVLSGFLIGRIYLRSQLDAHDTPGSFTLWGFWSARWFRTLPPYLAALGIYAIAQHFFHNNAVHPYYFLFLQNYIGIDGFGPSWSLCVEEHFYLALPILGGLVLRFFPRKTLLWLLPLLALIPETLRLIALQHHALTFGWFWKSHFHCEGMILGVWLAYVFVDRRDLWDRLRRPALALSIVPIVVLMYQHLHSAQPLPFQATVFLIYAIGYAAWLRVLYDLRWTPATAPTRLVEKIVRGLALSSYSIYLLHTLMFSDVHASLESLHRGPVKSLIVLSSALIASTIFYFAIEKPTIALRGRLLRS